MNEQKQKSECPTHTEAEPTPKQNHGLLAGLRRDTPAYFHSILVTRRE